MQDQKMQDQKLSELDDWQLHDSGQDVRGRTLTTAAGADLGTVRDMLVDVERERVSAVVLEDGRTIPVESLEITDEAVIAHDSGAERRPTVAVYEAMVIRPVR